MSKIPTIEDVGFATERANKVGLSLYIDVRQLMSGPRMNNAEQLRVADKIGRHLDCVEGVRPLEDVYDCDDCERLIAECICNRSDAAG